MKTVQFQIPDELHDRLEGFAAKQGSDYASVNTPELSGRDALFCDLLMLGLDEIDAGEEEFPDDVED